MRNNSVIPRTHLCLRPICTRSLYEEPVSFRSCHSLCFLHPPASLIWVTYLAPRTFEFEVPGLFILFPTITPSKSLSLRYNSLHTTNWWILFRLCYLLAWQHSLLLEKLFLWLLRTSTSWSPCYFWLLFSHMVIISSTQTLNAGLPQRSSLGSLLTLQPFPTRTPPNPWLQSLSFYVSNPDLSSQLWICLFNFLVTSLLYI